MDASYHRSWVGAEAGHLVINPFPTHGEQVLYGRGKVSSGHLLSLTLWSSPHPVSGWSSLSGNAFAKLPGWQHLAVRIVN